jgi:hypothetical protein
VVISNIINKVIKEYYMSKMKQKMEEFNYYFDNNNAGVEISGIKYSASEILFNLNPEAYQVEFDTWLEMFNE